LNISKERLEEGQGFDRGDWPNFEDRQVRGRIDALFDNGEARVDADVEVEAKTIDESPHVMRLSELQNLSVVDAQNEQLATIDDLVLEKEKGEISYATLSVGGVLGIGARIVAVPLDAMHLQPETRDDDAKFVLHTTEERLENAPEIERGQYERFADAQFREQVDSYFQSERTALQPDEARQPDQLQQRELPDRLQQQP
jgi:sporulation protein YlmC with PRC-barrel domain